MGNLLENSFEFCTFVIQKQKQRIMEKEIDKILSKFSEVANNKAAKIFRISATSDIAHEVFYAATNDAVAKFLHSELNQLEKVEIRRVEVQYSLPRMFNVFTEDFTKVAVLRTNDFKYEVYDESSDTVKDEYGTELKDYDFVRISGCPTDFEIQFMNRGRLFLLGEDGTEIEVTPDKVYKLP